MRNVYCDNKSPFHHKQYSYQRIILFIVVIYQRNANTRQFVPMTKYIQHEKKTASKTKIRGKKGTEYSFSLSLCLSLGLRGHRAHIFDAKRRHSESNRSDDERMNITWNNNKHAYKYEDEQSMYNMVWSIFNFTCKILKYKYSL